MISSSTMKPSHALLVSTLAFAGLAQASPSAGMPAYLGDEQCRIAPVQPPPADGKISWSGACKDGYASGQGKLAWRVGPNKDSLRLEGALVRGEIDGVATLASDQWSYTGSFRKGVPHGSGYMRMGNGDQYEGGIVDGMREGPGQFVGQDRTTYDGNWKRGKRDGFGKAVFATGGSYEGEWQQGVFHGQGKIVYAGGNTYEGQFVGGRAAHHAGVAEAAPAAAPVRQFDTKGEELELGSHMRTRTGTSPLPPEATWEQLTPEQQAMVRAAYPALETGDEPPYPLTGNRGFSRAIGEIYNHYPGHTGIVTLFVVVGADGAPKSVKTLGATHPEMGRYLGRVAMAQRFKPARCRGQACEMIYRYAVNFTTRL